MITYAVLLLINILQILSAVSGTVIIKKYNVPNIIHHFVFFLWFTVIIEILGWIPDIIYEVEKFSHLKDSIWSANYWFYNIYFMLNYSFYIYFFIKHINNANFVKVMYYIIGLYILVSTLTLFKPENLFESHSLFIVFVGPILMTVTILFYLYEIVSSNKILQIKKNFVFYIAVSSLLFHLIVTPIFIYSIHHKNYNPDFIKFRGIVLYGANILLYSVYTYSFIQCLRKNNSY